METSETLYAAADLIEERGWAKGVGWLLTDETHDGLCLEGAIQAASGLPAVSSAEGGQLSCEINRCAAGQAVKAYLEGRHSASSFLFLWNDRSTADEVIATLRAAAVIEAAREQAAVDTPAVSAAPVRSGL